MSVFHECTDTQRGQKMATGSTRAMGCPYRMWKINLSTGEEKQALLRVLTSEPSPNKSQNI